MHALSQGGGRLKYIEQKEIYASTVDPSKQTSSSALANASLCCRTGQSGTNSIINSLKSTKMPESVLEPVLQARSETMRKHSELIKLLVDDNSTNATQAKMQGHSNASIGTTASKSTLSLTSESSSTCDSSTNQNSSVSPDTDNSRTPTSLQAQAVSPLSHSSESPSPNVLQVNPSPTSGSTVSSDVSVFQIGWLGSQNHLMQDLQMEPFDPSAYYPVDQNGIQGLLESDPSSSASFVPATSPVAYSPLLSNPTLQGAVSPGQFLNQASPISNYSSVISGTSSSNDVAVSDVSSPPTAFSPEMRFGSHTTVSDDSIPLSELPIPFQNSQIPAFVPQALTLNDFNHQIPSSFNVSYAQMSNCTFSDLDKSVLDAQTMNSSNSLFLNPSDLITRQPTVISGDVTCPTPNGMDSKNTGDAVVPNPESEHDIMDVDSNSHLHANVTMNCDTTNSAESQSRNHLLDSQMNTSSMCSSSSEIQDILQQFF